MTESCAGSVSVVEEAEGEWRGEVAITNPGAEDMHGWTLQLVFSAAVDYLGAKCSINQLLFVLIIVNFRLCCGNGDRVGDVLGDSEQGLGR